MVDAIKNLRYHWLSLVGTLTYKDKHLKNHTNVGLGLTFGDKLSKFVQRLVVTHYNKRKNVEPLSVFLNRPHNSGTLQFCCAPVSLIWHCRSAQET